MIWTEDAKAIQPEVEIMTFARCGNVEGLREIVTPENINFQDHKGHTPLMLACCNGCYEAAEFLLYAGAEIDRRDCCGNTALMSASFGGYLDIVKLLIAHGANPDLENPQGLSPLGFAELFERTEVQQYLGGMSSANSSSATHH
jgi:hypothetical protein